MPQFRSLVVLHKSFMVELVFLVIFVKQVFFSHIAKTGREF